MMYYFCYICSLEELDTLFEHISMIVVYNSKCHAKRVSLNLQVDESECSSTVTVVGGMDLYVISNEPRKGRKVLSDTYPLCCDY